MSDFILHAVECLCFDLKSKYDNGEKKYFSVCTEINQHGKFVEHFAQCPSCGNIHWIYGVGKSKLQGKDESISLPKMDELEFEIPERVVRLLKTNFCPIHIWLAATYIFRHKIFPNCLILSQEQQQMEENKIPNVVTKMLMIDGENEFKIVIDTSEPLTIVKP